MLNNSFAIRNVFAAIRFFFSVILLCYMVQINLSFLHVPRYQNNRKICEIQINSFLFSTNFSRTDDHFLLKYVVPCFLCYYCWFCLKWLEFFFLENPLTSILNELKRIIIEFYDLPLLKNKWFNSSEHIKKVTKHNYYTEFLIKFIVLQLNNIVTAIIFKCCLFWIFFSPFKMLFRTCVCVCMRVVYRN